MVSPLKSFLNTLQTRKQKRKLYFLTTLQINFIIYCYEDATLGLKTKPQSIEARHQHLTYKDFGALDS